MSRGVLDLDALARAELVSRPFRWARVGAAFHSAGEADRIARSAPASGFTESTRTAGAQKRYRMANRTLVDRERGALAMDDLTEEWRGLVAQLRSDEYLEAVSEAIGSALAGCTMEVRLCRYGPGCWMDPHTDRPEKIITHVVYLNRGWRASWGGGLRILGSQRMDDVVDELPPVLDTAALLVRADQSWHAVAPVTDAAAGERASLLVHLMRP
jgi:hypothetical protein